MSQAKIAQEEGRPCDSVLGKGASVASSLTKIKEPLVGEKERLRRCTLLPRFRRGRRRSA